MKAARSLVLIAGLLAHAAPAGAQIPDLDSLPPASCATEDGRTRVLLLGSYHMSNPGADRFNLQADDVLAPTRQAEIAELVASLAVFAPTKVAIEAPYGDSTSVHRYAAYLRDEHTLARSESEQVGFRLARQLGHSTIFPIDYRMGLDFGSLGRLAERNPAHGARLAGMQAFGTAAVEQMGAWLSEGTITDMYYQLNRPEVLRISHWAYVDYIAPIVDGDDFAGPALLGTWYERNVRIFANLTRTAEAGDRVLIVYGMGHVPILKHLLESSAVFCYEDPLPYLE